LLVLLHFVVVLFLFFIKEGFHRARQHANLI
jgi:hypothetical protein